MGDMGFNTTLDRDVLTQALHDHIDRCMKTVDVTCQLMKNDLNRDMQEWMYIPKIEMNQEEEAR